MATNIDPLQPDGQARPAPAVTRGRSVGDFAATLGAARADAAVRAGVEPSAPEEVHADMAAASRAWHSLQTSGRELRFDEGGGGVQITLHQVSGERLAVLDLHDVYALIPAERRGLQPS